MTDCEPIASLEDAREEWSELAGRSENVFATWEWAATWWRHFGAGRELALLRCGRAGEPLALIPLYAERRGPLRLLRFIGHGAGDALGPICDPHDAGAAAAALRRGLRAGAAGRWDALLSERVPAGAFGDALGGRALRVEASPVLEIAGRSWDRYLAESSRNLREKLRRNTRRLAREHALDYRLCEDPDQVEERMDVLQRLHRLQWSEGSSFGHPPLARFHREFATIALRRGWLRLWTMELDGEPAAAWYGFRLGATEAYYQSGRDPRWNRFSVGFLMLMRTLRSAFDDGLERYAFLRGDEPYKGRFATGDGRLETRALGRGPLTEAAIGGGALALRLPWLRRRVVAAMR